jgi:hypothetical protein
MLLRFHARGGKGKTDRAKGVLGEEKRRYNERIEGTNEDHCGKFQPQQATGVALRGSTD